MPRRQLSSANQTTIIVALAGTVGTVITAYFAFRGSTASVELPIIATQTAQAQIATSRISVGDTATIFPDTPVPTVTAALPPTTSSSIDVPDPLGSDALEFANTIRFKTEPKGSLSRIDGIWNSEWCCREGNVWVSGTATILVSDDYWVHIVQEDKGGGQYVIKAKFIDSKLIGRYINVNVTSDTHPWIGILVDDNRIEGFWKYGNGKEWNFLRSP